MYNFLSSSAIPLFLYLRPFLHILLKRVSCFHIRHCNRLTELEASYEGVSKSFRTGHLALELQMVQLSATKYSCIV
jgi:hypothetical protein